MNCKPGDLAVCIRNAARDVPVSPLGKFCSVLSAAPMGEFRLPDGFLQLAIHTSGYWVVEWANDMHYPIDSGGYRVTRFGVAPDYALRPIRPQPDDAVDEVIQRIGTPHKEVA